MVDRAGADLIPAQYSPRFTRFFGTYVRRLVRRRFFAARITPEAMRVLAAVETDPGPAILLLSHQSWWDPLVGVMLSERLLPTRPVLGPMDSAELRRFMFLRKVGVFGVDPSARDAIESMTAYLEAEFSSRPRTALWITPQGEFADPRTPIRLRPGAAAAAARLGAPAVAAVCVEYTFWQDQRPELFVHAGRGESPDPPSLTGWHRAMQQCMTRCAAELAERVTARDLGAFVDLLPRGGTRINPVFDLVQRLRGRHRDIIPRTRGRPAS